MPPNAIRSRSWYRPSCCARCILNGSSTLSVSSNGRGDPMHKFLILGLVSCVLGAPAVALADPAYSVKIDAPPGKTAQKGVVKIVIQPGTGFHVNKDYPTSLTLTGIPAGVLVDKMKQTAKDAAKLTEQEAEFDVSYTASAA